MPNSVTFDKLSNIIGVKLPEWVLQQLKTRSDLGSKLSRNTENALYIGNKSAWVRLVSSVNINNQEDKLYFNNIGATTSGKDTDSDEAFLSKNWVLFGGSSQYLRKKILNEYGEQSYLPENRLRSGIGSGGAYGTLGQSEILKYGYRPMPGLTSVKIETQGRLGSVRQATVDFKCWDKDQLDIMDALYFKLGYHMFLDWGHVKYYPNVTDVTVGDPPLQSTELFAVDPFTNNITKEELLYKIADTARKTDGNYGAMLGIVTNFNFKLNQEGGWDCTIKIMGLGGLGDSMKINGIRGLTYYNKKFLKQYKEITGFASPQEEGNKRDLSSITPITLLYSSLSEVEAGDISNSPETLITEGPKKYIVNSENLYGPTTYYDDGQGNKRPYTILTSDRQKIDQAYQIIKSVNLGGLGKIDISEVSTQRNYGFIGFFLTTTTQGVISQGQVVSGTEGNYYGINNAKSIGNTLNSIYTKYQELDGDARDQNYNKTTKPSREESLKYVTLSQIDKEAQDQLIKTNDVEANRIYKNKVDAIIKSDLQKFRFAKKILNAVPWSEGSSLFKDRPFTDQNNHNEQLSAISKIFQVYKEEFKNPETYKAVSNDFITQLQSKFKDLPSGSIEFESSEKFLFRVSQIFNGQTLETVLQQAEATRVIEEQQQDQVADSQVDSTSRSLSNIESVLRAIQLSSLVKGRLDFQYSEVPQIKTIDFNQNEISEIYNNNGIFSEYISTDERTNSELYNLQFETLAASNDVSDTQNLTNAELDNSEYYKEDISPIDRFKIQLKYGFASNVLAYKTKLVDDNRLYAVKPVNYYGNLGGVESSLFNTVIVPYSQYEAYLEDKTGVDAAIYIKLGHLLFLLNHTCTLYDLKNKSKDSDDLTKFKSPLVYIDFNPETNFCLSTPRQLSANPYEVLIPFEGSDADFRSLFDADALEKGSSGEYLIKPPSGSTESNDLFTPRGSFGGNRDNVSGNIPQFRFGEGPEYNPYRGKIMNVLLNMDYLIDKIKQYATNDKENKVYLKPFMEAILADITKNLGGINILRFSYNDDANAYQIVDDNYIPAGSIEQGRQLESKKENSSELPLFGKNSIARSLEIKTEISNKLANMIAISANADPKTQSALSSGGDHFGAYNSGSYDRYVPNRVQSTEGGPSPDDAKRRAAIQFNKAIKSFYCTGITSKDLTSFATSYYIDRMMEINGQEAPTRSSAMIPISVNFTTDGIFGMSMGHAFTMPKELLPHTYSPRTGEMDRVGFVIVGLNHSIDSNSWITDIKANMIFLKDASVFNPSGERPNISKNVEFTREEEVESAAGAAANDSGYPYSTIDTPVGITNVVLGSGYLGDVVKDYNTGIINQNLISDINEAAKKAGITVIITTAVNKHSKLTSSGNPSRHGIGKGVDVAIVIDSNNKLQSLKDNQNIKPDIQRFTSILNELGYAVNQGEFSNKKAVLTYGYVDKKHEDHVHISRVDS